ncbi:MAG: ADOP family duplicated permease [Terriglobales bacterium]
MPSLREWLYRLAASLRGDRSARRLREELDTHAALLAAEGAGRRCAALRLGGPDQIEAAWRDQRGLRWLDDLRRDAKLALRSLRRSPGFTAVVVISLALGIGTNAAIFSVLNAAAWRSLPVPDPGRLTLLYWHAAKRPGALNQSGGQGPPVAGAASYSLAYPTYEQLRDHSQGVLSSIFGFAPLGFGPTALEVGGETATLRATLVTGEFFSGLGVKVARGRLIGRGDERDGAPTAIVLSYGYWTRQFARAPGIVGRAALIAGTPATIVGVATPSFHGVQTGSEVDAWVSMSPSSPATLTAWGLAPPNVSLYRSTDYWWLQMMARLPPGVSRQQAVAALGPLFRSLTLTGLSPAPKADATPQLGLQRGEQGFSPYQGSGSQTLWILMALVGLLLLLACVNIAALLLARASARRQEISVRLALGASRARLVRQLLTESLLLALGGGALGAALAPLGVRLLLALMGGDGTPLPLTVGVDGPIVVFTAAVAVLVGIGFGLAPAMRSTRVGVASALAGGRGGTGRVRLGADKALVIAQVALSLVLLIGAGLFLRTLTALQRRPLGFNPRNLLLVSLDGTQAGYRGPALLTLYRRVQVRLQALPSVAAATSSRLPLLTGWSSNGGVTVPGLKLSDRAAGVYMNTVGPDFFKTLGIPLLYGRGITADDTAANARVAVVNQALVEKIFGGATPIGRSIGESLFSNQTVYYRIVGVCANARFGGVRGAMPPTLYEPWMQAPLVTGLVTFEVRFSGSESAAAVGIRLALHDIDPALAPTRLELQTAASGLAHDQQRMFADLGGFFGLLGLLLAAIGIEGTMAYAVARRRSELGIRMALGARGTQLQWSVLRETLGMTLAGVAAGVIGGYFAAQIIAAQLFGVAPTDPASFAAAAGLMLAVALAAAWLPARRAARLDPAQVLRAQ